MDWSGFIYSVVVWIQVQIVSLVDSDFFNNCSVCFSHQVTSNFL